MKEAPKPIIGGRDLIALGFEVTKRTGEIKFGEVIKLAENLRDEKEMTREEILALIYDYKDKSLDELAATMKEKLKSSEVE